MSCSIYNGSNFAAHNPQKGSGESKHKKIYCYRNVCGTNQIAPRQISDVIPVHIMPVLRIVEEQGEDKLSL